MAKRRIFISHISSEAELASYLKQQLARDFLGLLDIFVSSDQETIQAGVEWLRSIETALKGAHLQVVLCSKGSVSKPWVTFEAGAAWLRRIPIIPVCHSGMKPIDLPLPLCLLQGIELSGPGALRKLYASIATALGIQPPDIDYQKRTSEIKEVEQRCIQSSLQPENIENPRILCASSEQYSEPSFEFELDVAILEKIFPGRVDVERKLTGKRLREMLIDVHYDILHLVLAVDPDNGDLIFSPIDLDTYKPATSQPDTLPAQGFSALLRESNTCLVVLATCKALLLAVEVAHVANMAASDAVIYGNDAAEWSECFYSFLAKGIPLHKAFDLTRSQLTTPIRPIRNKDVTFLAVRSNGAT